MPSEISRLDLHEPGLRLVADLIPWDEEAFGFPVAQIHALQVLDPILAQSAYRHFSDWMDRHAVSVASCRLPHAQMRESMFLEQQGFRFVETLLHPRLDNPGAYHWPEDAISIAPAHLEDLPALQYLAENAFHADRYHMDPRMDAGLAGKRYARWIANSCEHPRQRLLQCRENESLIAFFIVEDMPQNGMYWHLTAIAPEYQGRGYGRRVWQAMLRQHGQNEISFVATAISAHNIAILNLYARLGFRFSSPEITLHWKRAQ
jgi:RimJ/RimL family protein N-acetyltransferase